jgi:histone acetyltransferase (RNA polymerase elongator complex component)
VPVFIPYQGCLHRCVFCEQEKITAEKKKSVNAAHVTDIIETAVRSPRFDPQHAEVAFYGGTFTSLELPVIEELLGAVSPFLREGFINGIRVSTRPDALDHEKLALMKQREVKTVELGAQSMDDHVLALSKRGHSSQDVADGVLHLKKLGFRVGVQLMPGLPGDSRKTFLATVESIVRLAPDMARLYPAVVIRGTALARMYEAEEYVPLDLAEAVELCAESCSMLEGAGIPVIRMGLMSSPSLLKKGVILGGPWHAAFGFLVRCRMYQKTIASQLPGRGAMKRFKIRVQERDASLLRGYRNEGIAWISMMTGAEVLGVHGDPSFPPGRIEVFGE